MGAEQDDPEWYGEIGEALENRGDKELALEAYKTGIEAAHRLDLANPNRAYYYSGAINRLLSLLAQLGRDEEALPLLERWLQQRERGWEHAKRARVLVRAGRWQEAADAYRQVISRLDPNECGQWEYRVHLLRVLVELKRDGEAQMVAEELVEKTPARVERLGNPFAGLPITPIRQRSKTLSVAYSVASKTAGRIQCAGVLVV